MDNISSNTGIIKYQGRVTVSAYRDKRLLFTYQQHNEGLSALFNGICNLFAGKASLDKIKPAYIAAYTLVDETAAPDRPWADLSARQVDNTSMIQLASSYLTLDSCVVDTDTATITYKAKIPYGYLTAENIYALALLPASFDVINPEESALACFRLADSTTWKPLHCSRAESENILLVEWQLKFSDGGETE